MAKSLADFVEEALRNVAETTPAETFSKSSEAEWKVLDVREPDEFAAGSIPNAINIPRGFLEVKADLSHPKNDARLADRSQRIICYCGGGHRSALAAKTLQEMGFQDVLSMAGGWSAYEALGLPIEKKS